MASDPGRRRRRTPILPIELLAAALHWGALGGLLILVWALAA